MRPGVAGDDAAKQQPTRIWHELVRLPSLLSGYGRCMDEAEHVLERLERIDALRAAGAPAAELLVELRALVDEAEVWARLEGGDAGEAAAARLRLALARDMIVV